VSVGHTGKNVIGGSNVHIPELKSAAAVPHQECDVMGSETDEVVAGLPIGDASPRRIEGKRR